MRGMNDICLKLMYMHYPEKLRDPHHDLLLLPSRTKLQKDEKVSNLHNKKKYIIQVGNSKQAVSYGLFLLKNVHNTIKLN